MAKILSADKKIAVIGALAEGPSIRSIVQEYRANAAAQA
jgi:hypothetical protein